MNEQSGDFDLPLARPAPDAPVATLWVVLTALFMVNLTNGQEI